MNKKRSIFAGLLFSLMFVIGADSAFAQGTTKRSRNRVKSATWQTSVNDQNQRKVVLGVRDKWGNLGNFSATFAVTAPDGKTFRVTVVGVGDEWTYINFPNAFQGNPRANGNYKVVFYVDGVIIGRDRFRFRR